jgi:hypothetical protein
MPFVIGLTKHAIHRCGKCLNEVKTGRFFGLNSLDDKIIASNIGSFGFMLTRRYLLYIVMTITAGLVLYVFILVEENQNFEKRPFIVDTWEMYSKNCGFNQYLTDKRKASNYFDKFYYGKGVSWDGYVI